VRQPWHGIFCCDFGAFVGVVDITGIAQLRVGRVIKGLRNRG